MTAARAPSRRIGFALLEVLVALVVLTLVGLAYLELFHQSHRIATGASDWSDAVAYAENAIEQAKLGTLPLNASPTALPGGFRRQLTRRPWQDGLDLVTVSVFLPDGAHFDLSRLAKPRSPGSAGPDEAW
ncbi:MAG TPA: prepilin-type N-terminal cleavage/methylation domain-containing protein [Gemmatimonadales bacterium]|nr:prepilin-type N-terminal cleavage/methylation domain-containing protein [Gemmatimonadales bacterium]